MSDENIVKSTAEAVKAVADAVPVYQDALQPAAREVGQALKTVAKAIHVALAPLSALVWGYERIADYLGNRLAELLKDVPPQEITTPPPTVAGPAIEAMRFTANDDELREMFARLIASAMSRCTIAKAHPAFVEVVKQLTSGEARMIQHLASDRYAPHPLLTLQMRLRPPRFMDGGILTLKRNVTMLPRLTGTSSDLAAVHVDNLARLKLIELREDVPLHEDRYRELNDLPDVIDHLNDRDVEDLEPVVKRGFLIVTDFGQSFLDCCVLPVPTSVG